MCLSIFIERLIVFSLFVTQIKLIYFPSRITNSIYFLYNIFDAYSLRFTEPLAKCVSEGENINLIFGVCILLRV
jgi:hypothetical protein